MAKAVSRGSITGTHAGHGGSSRHPRKRQTGQADLHTADSASYGRTEVCCGARNLRAALTTASNFDRCHSFLLAVSATGGARKRPVRPYKGVRFFDCRARRLCRAIRVSGKRYRRTNPYTRGCPCAGTTGSLAQPPKTKEPYGCDIPLAGAHPTVCQLQAVGVDLVGGGLRRKKRGGTLLPYVGTADTQHRP